MTTYKGDIPGDLTLNKGDDAKAVTSVGGSVDAGEGATLELPACTSVGGYVDAGEGATLELRAATAARIAAEQAYARYGAAGPSDRASE